MSFDGRLLAGITVLAAVVQGRSFVRAGEALGITTSGVSRSIARLEDRLGIRLLDRTPRSVALTDEGKRFYEQVGPLLSTIEDAANSVSGSAGAVRGRLRVDIDPYFSRLILSGKIGSFLAMHPDLVLEMHGQKTPDLARKDQAREIGEDREFSGHASGPGNSR